MRRLGLLELEYIDLWLRIVWSEACWSMCEVAWGNLGVLE